MDNVPSVVGEIIIVPPSEVAFKFPSPSKVPDGTVKLTNMF